MATLFHHSRGGINMGRNDRLARLHKVEHLLYLNKTGMTLDEIAGECGVSVRTVRRDLAALESTVGVPIYKDGQRWCIVEGYHLPPISLSLPEAMTIFLSARLMLNYAHRYDPNIKSTFFKLNSVVPSPLREQVQRTMEWMQKLPQKEAFTCTMVLLAEAWVKQRRVRISYHTFGETEVKIREINPYFIEPAAAGHSSYVVAYCHLAGSIRVFKIERIKAIEMTSEKYDIPDDFDANKYFASSWGMFAGGEVETIKLKFSPGVAQIFEEVVWHPSQVVGRQADGSLVMTLNVSMSVELLGWILRWGEKVEVLEPQGLREKIVHTAQAMLNIYGEQ